jgi:aspartyl-tRNA(Asn)/glutamyl-tRNA(Gln) amidotransferase subunit C
MKIDKDILYKVAHLARLEIRTEEEEQLLKDLAAMVSWVEQLEEVDTDEVEPLTNMSKEINVLREDETEQYSDREDILKNAPDTDSDFFKVPKFLHK